MILKIVGTVSVEELERPNWKCCEKTKPQICKVVGLKMKGPEEVFGFWAYWSGKDYYIWESRIATWSKLTRNVELDDYYAYEWLYSDLSYLSKNPEYRLMKDQMVRES